MHKFLPQLLLLCAPALIRAQEFGTLDTDVVPVDIQVDTTNQTVDSSTLIIDVDNTPKNALEATAWSIIFTYALLAQRSVLTLLTQLTPINTFFHTRQFPTVNSNSIIGVNPDVLYSFTVLDLSQTDLLLTIPTIEDRFWSYVIWDLYGNAVAEISNANDHTAGTYRIKRDAENEVGVRNGNVTVSTAYASLAIRLAIKANTSEDLATLLAYQDASTIELTDLSASTQVPPLANISTQAVSDPKAQLEVAAQLMPYNPAQTISDRKRIDSITARAGIQNSTFTAQASVDLMEASAIANNSIAADMSNPANSVDLGNGWTIPIPSYQGNYKTNYAAQASKTVQYVQTLDLALIPLHPLISGDLVFNETSSLLVSFSAKPKVKSQGFWNIGSYDSALQLVPNPIDRYGIGSEGTTLEYTTGGKVYGPDAESGDGEFQVLLQLADLAPPASWTGNWLPVASAASITFRFYGPEQALSDGSYVWPKVERVAAITE